MIRKQPVAYKSDLGRVFGVAHSLFPSFDIGEVAVDPLLAPNEPDNFESYFSTHPDLSNLCAMLIHDYQGSCHPTDKIGKNETVQYARTFLLLLVSGTLIGIVWYQVTIHGGALAHFPIEYIPIFLFVTVIGLVFLHLSTQNIAEIKSYVLTKRAAYR